MSDTEPLPEELKGIEAHLSSLVPTAAGFDRDRLMFRSGQLSASSRRHRWLLRTWALSMTVVSLGLAIRLSQLDKAAIVVTQTSASPSATLNVISQIDSPRREFPGSAGPGSAEPWVVWLNPGAQESLAANPSGSARPLKQWQLVAAGLDVEKHVPGASNPSPPALPELSAPPRAGDRRQLEDLLHHELRSANGDRS